MSNELQVKYTRFTDLDSNGIELETKYGVRIYDEYSNLYFQWDTFEELTNEVNLENLFDWIESIRYGDEWDSNTLFDDLSEYGGIYFNGQLIEYDSQEEE